MTTEKKPTEAPIHFGTVCRAKGGFLLIQLKDGQELTYQPGDMVKLRKGVTQPATGTPTSKWGEVTNRAKCGSCPAEVLWVITKNGRKMPVNPADDTSHYATCPDAASWRRSR